MIAMHTASLYSASLERDHVPWNERLGEEQHQPSKEIRQHVLENVVSRVQLVVSFSVISQSKCIHCIMGSSKMQ